MSGPHGGGPYVSPESEFWYNVIPQANMPLCGVIENEFDVDRISAFLTAAAQGSADDFQRRVTEAILAEPQIFNDLRQLLGISDKRAYLELSDLASRLQHP